MRGFLPQAHTCCGISSPLPPDLPREAQVHGSRLHGGQAVLALRQRFGDSVDGGWSRRGLSTGSQRNRELRMRSRISQ